MAAAAEEAAQGGLTAEVVLGDAQEPDLPMESFDALASSLVLFRIGFDQQVRYTFGGGGPGGRPSAAAGRDHRFVDGDLLVADLLITEEDGHPAGSCPGCAPNRCSEAAPAPSSARCHRPRGASLNARVSSSRALATLGPLAP